MVQVMTNKGLKKGVIVKDNNKTVVVKLEDGRYIKRHKEKHIIEEISE